MYVSERERNVPFIVSWVLRANIAWRGCGLCIPGISQDQVGWGSECWPCGCYPTHDRGVETRWPLTPLPAQTILWFYLVKWEEKEIMVFFINTELSLNNYLEQGGLQEACLWHCFMLIFIHAVLKKYCRPIYSVLVCSTWEIHLKVSVEVHNQRQSC